MFRLSSSLILSVALVALVGCGTTTATQPPVDLTQTTDTTPDASIPSGLEARVSRLESQMQEAQPTLKKVEAMETHFKALSLELDRIVTLPPESVAPVEKPTPVTAHKEVAKSEPKKEAVKKTEIKKESLPAGVLAVTSVRVGEQPKEITRIVLDTTKAAELHYDLDNSEALLVIDIPSAQWKAAESMTLKKSPMVKSFHASQDDTGAHLIIELKQKAKVVTTARLNPSGSQGNRVYIDVAPAK